MGVRVRRGRLARRRFLVYISEVLEVFGRLVFVVVVVVAREELAMGERKGALTTYKDM